MLGVEALQGLWIVFRCRTPDGKGTLRVMDHDDALRLHVDHRLEGIRQLSVPLADLRPNRVTELILGVRCHRNFTVLAREQKPGSATLRA